MNRFVIPAAIGAGAVFVGWIALGFVGTSYLALCMTLLIGAVYAMGLREMSSYRATTHALRQALTDMGEPLESRLGCTVGPRTRRLATRRACARALRASGWGLAGPIAHPVHSLACWSCWARRGTFLGTGHGARKAPSLALEGSADLQDHSRGACGTYQRTGPVLRYLGGWGGDIGFAGSGVRTLPPRAPASHPACWTRALPRCCGPSTLAHQREAGLLAQQQQVQALPAVAEQLSRLMEQIEQRNLTLNTRLEAQQQAFHADVGRACAGLATAVGRSLQDSLLAGAKQASEAIVPVMESALQQLVAEDAPQQHTQMREALQAAAPGRASRLPRRHPHPDGRLGTRPE